MHPNHVAMGSRVKIRAGTILFGSAVAPIRIGDDVYINAKCVLHGGALLTIGDRVTLAIGVLVHTDSGPNTSPLLRASYPIVASPVTIGDDVWIGDYAVVLPGVTIGKGRGRRFSSSRKMSAGIRRGRPARPDHRGAEVIYGRSVGRYPARR